MRLRNLMRSAIWIVGVLGCSMWLLASSRTWLSAGDPPAHPAGSEQQGPQISADEIKLTTRPYTPQASKTFRVETNLVLVPVVVRDSKGMHVGGLGKDDFQLLDNGKPQTITSFSVQTASGAVPDPSAPAPAGRTAPAPAAAAKPRFIAFFFDDLNSALGDIVAARNAAEKFVREELQPRDHIGIFTSSASVTLDFTRDARALLDSLGQIRTQMRGADEGPSACPPINPWQAHLIVNVRDSQAIELAIAEGLALGCLQPVSGKQGLAQTPELNAGIVKNRAETILSAAELSSVDTLAKISSVIRHLAKMQGEPMLLLASSGFFTRASQAGRRQDKVVDEALRAGIVINSLDAKGLTAEPPKGGRVSSQSAQEQRRPVYLAGGDLSVYSDTLRNQFREAMNDPMALLAEGTGGRFFKNNNDLERGLRELVAAPEVSYLLGFQPQNLKPDGKLHELQVKPTVSRSLTVQARRGYYAPTQAEQAQQNASERFDAEVLADDTVTEFPARVTAQPDKVESGAPAMKVALHVDVRALHFERRSGRSLAKLRCVIAMFDTQGNHLGSLEVNVDLALKKETLEQLTKTGLYQHWTLQAPSGSYKLRAVVQELTQGTMAALTQPVVIP